MNSLNVGFVGLGTMGAPMAANISKAGYELYLFDANQEVADDLAHEIDAHVYSDASQLAKCDIVIFMLPTSDVVRSVLFSDEKKMNIPFTPQTTLVDMSSSDPVETVETGALLASQGIALVDAPVSGARKRAIEGTLSIMVGADDDSAVEHVKEVLKSMSKNIYRTGKLGTGHAMKALNNFVAAASFSAALEAMVAGERFGLDPAVMVDVFNNSTGQSFVTSNVLPDHIVNKQFASGFSLPLMTKDVRIANELQQVMGHFAPVSKAVTTTLQDALDALGNVDHTVAYEFWRNQ